MRRGDDGTVLVLAEAAFTEPSEATRKSRSTPLPWCKMRSPADCSPEGEIHALRIRSLKARKNGWQALAILDELTRVLTARSVALRWYLVGGDFRAATAGEVAQWIAHPDVRAVRAALRVLEAVGLLERVPAPDFAAAHREDRKAVARNAPVAHDEPESGEDRPAAAVGGTVSGAAPEKCAENGSSQAEKRATFRRGAGQRGGDPSRLETIDGETGDAESASPGGSADRQTRSRLQDAASAPSAPPPDGKTADGPPAVAGCEGGGMAGVPRKRAGPAASEADPPTTQPAPTPPRADDGEDADDAEARDDGERVVARELRGGVVEVGVETADPHGADADADAGPTADEPTGADPGGAARQRRDKPAAVAGGRSGADPSRGGAASGRAPPAGAPPPGGGPGIVHDCEAVADRVYCELYPDRAAELVAARQGGDGGTPETVERFRARERGAFGSAWQAVLRAELPAGELAEVYGRIVGEAGRLARKRCKIRKGRGAILLAWLGKHMAKGIGGPRWAAAKGGLRIARQAAG